MAQRDCQGVGELDVLQQDWNISETTICLPTPSPAKHASTYLPQAGPQVLEESNSDPFYLEQSLAATPTWETCNTDTSAIRYDRDSEGCHHYYPLSLTNGKVDPNRSTLAQLELENNLRFHRYTSSTEDGRHLHNSQYSFSSNQTGSTTPDLTPSSSFSSSYTTPSCPDAVLKATEKLYIHAQQAQEDPHRALHQPASTPPKFSLPPPPPVAPLSTASTRPTTPADPRSEPHSTFPMRYETSSMSSSSRRRKPHPTLPNLSGATTSSQGTRRKQSSPGTRPPLDPSMISPPSLINPVTMEPHATHFDQALFIPANECPSPLPSPVGSSPPISRQWTATSIERPSVSTMDANCEQSVWESDSDTESVGHKSLSRKPIDTLRKVRSRAKLRGAKSQPKLQPTTVDDLYQEKFPSLPVDPVGVPIPDPYHTASLDQPIAFRRPSASRDAMRPHPLQTIRLLAPSNTSVNQPRSRNDSVANESNIDRTAAAAIQARSRRRQYSNSLESANSDKERFTSFCYEQHSPTASHDVSVESRPFFQRMFDSLRSLNCRGASRK